ncbi:MAG: ASKHA domain-containing protein [Dehalococcoidia bacterium]|nr:ASKHA domain-containing protein [Dehalococcoidia bacterium]
MIRNPIYQVRFEPSGVTTAAEAGTKLSEAAIAAGVHINAACGGMGSCGACLVLIKDGQVSSLHTSKISGVDFARGVRQACQSWITTDLVVEIPQASHLEKTALTQQTVHTDAPLIAKGWTLEPMVSTIHLKLSAPSPDDNRSDLDRLRSGLKAASCPEPIEVPLEIMRGLGTILRNADWEVNATMFWDEGLSRLIRLEAGNLHPPNLALAFDIGTTAVRADLLDLEHGKILTSAIDYNGQISYGADVISRIIQCQKPGGLDRLQQAVVATLNKLSREMLNQATSSIEQVNHIMVAANTAMVHLLLGINPQYLRLSPYIPTISAMSPIKGRTLGLEVAPHAYVSFLPSVASYVGGDIISGITGTGIYQQDIITLYIDIGTNGELVAGNCDGMVTAAASAGPTFEGGGIRHGMLAINGAIEGFELQQATDEPTATTIGEERPRGICGSGLINIAAAMLRTGLISQNGKFNLDQKASRLRASEGVWEYVLAWSRDSATGRDIVLTEIDLANLIRSKAAIFAGCQTLIKSLGADFSDLGRVVIAGTFGCRLNIENAITLGLLPDLPRERFIFVGNGSLLGARLCSLSATLYHDAGRVARLMTNIELSENTDFMTNYVAAMFLPHTDMTSLFPSVKLRASS